MILPSAKKGMNHFGALSSPRAAEETGQNHERLIYMSIIQGSGSGCQNKLE